MTRRTPHFGALAESYDRLRPADENWWELFDVLVSEGDLVGRRVLDVGCGTGRLALALAERGARVWGVDPSEEMLARARAAGTGPAAFKLASAEALPFKDAWFERAVLWLVVHVVDRPRAFAELARVVGSGGRLVIATFNPEHFDAFWLNRLFPSLPDVDRARFPPPDLVVGELGETGFRDARARRVVQRARVRREDALERIRGRYISTLHLLDEEEYAEGVARAERELPEQVEYALDWAIVVAERP